MYKRNDKNERAAAKMGLLIHDMYRYQQSIQDTKHILTGYYKLTLKLLTNSAKNSALTVATQNQTAESAKSVAHLITSPCARLRRAESDETESKSRKVVRSEMQERRWSESRFA